MSEEPKKDIKAIFSEALEKQTAEERAAYLDKACGGDTKLRAKIEKLLKAHHEAGDFLEVPALEPDVTVERYALIEGPGTKIGRYELLELIGEGGMGLVYLAQQKEPVKRKVAFKIVKLGMDTKQVVARFEAERQTLAVLEHPNIAHVFDAGTTDSGRPYFVMEYVKGMSITRYCDERRLDVEERLRLFQEVCEGVHHAHQKGIIHRDIKPSNILVSNNGDKAVPKIIDFGIAKAITQPLTGETFFTHEGQLLGTPEYMSPEQAEMTYQNVDTRSDIYSLGVVLYELLAGALPFDRKSLEKAGFAELQRTIREDEPPLPSTRLTGLGEEAKVIAENRRTQIMTLTRRLHRELEWIPMKAMRKDRTRRYRSASELADDIQNYLSGAPLIAGPETVVYRAGKFVRKHAGSVATAALLLVVIVLGLVASILMGCRAEQARKQEAAARKQVEEALVRAENAEKATKEKAEELRRTLYVNIIQLADAKYREANIRRVRELLESCPDDLRGWEWYRLRHIADQSRMTLRGHDDWVGSIAISPDGKRIVSGSEDSTIKVWDAETGDELTTLRGHKKSVKSVAFSPDGRRIISGSGDKTIKIWDAATGVELMTLGGHGRAINVVAFSPDGKRIISGSADSTVKVWDTATGEVVTTLRGHKYRVTSVAISPDGKRIASGCGDNTIKIWDAATGTELITIHDRSFWHAYMDWVSIAFSPDGKRIISGSEDKKTIRVWDSATGAELMTLHGHEGSVWGLAFSPDGKRIISGGGDNTIKVWDSATGSELMTLRGHDNCVASIAISPDGKRIVSGSWDEAIKVWDAAIRGQAVTLDGHQDSVLSVAFSPDSRRIVSGSVDRTVKVWDTTTGAELMTLRGHDNGVKDALFSPDGKRIISSSYDNDIIVWDVATGTELMTLLGHDYWAESIAMSTDGRQLVSGGADNTVKVWDAATGAELMTLRGHRGSVKSVAISPDGKRIVSGSDDKTIKLWDATSGTEIVTLKGHQYTVMSVAFSPDSKRIVSGSLDKTVKLWDAATGTELMTLRGHRNWIESVAFSPDGKRIISGSGDDTIKVWDSATGAELMTLNVGGLWLSSIAFSPDGKTIAGASNEHNNIKFWESMPPAGGYEPRWTAQATRKVMDELVDQLYKETGSYDKVIDRLKADKTLDESVRKMAVQAANTHLWEFANRLVRESFDVVRLPGGQIEAYRLALGKAEMANGLEPNNPHISIILSLAQYRVGAYQDVLTTLTECEDWRPGPFVFRAMALHQLDRDEEARTALNQAHVLLEDWRSDTVFIVQPYVIEAEKLLAGEGTRLYSLWESIDEGRYKEAVQLIEQLRLSKDSETVARIEGAVKWLRKAYYNGAENKIIDGKFSEAISDYEGAVRVDPDYALAFNGLAWLRATCPMDEFRDGAKAIENATKACELTNFKKAHYVGILAAAYAEAGDFDSAVKRQKKAIDLLTEEEEELRGDFEERLKLYQSGKLYRGNP